MNNEEGKICWFKLAVCDELLKDDFRRCLNSFFIN